MRGSWLILAASLAVTTAAAGAVTDADRLDVYHQFRAAFDAHQYNEALPLAQKLVSMTEEQYGAEDRALVNPLSNLGTTQYRMGDYKNAEATYLRSVKIVEDAGNPADRLLLRPLHGLGATYHASGQYADASLTLKRALDLSRNLDGLFNPGQSAILDPLIASLVALELHGEAERHYQYAVQVAESSYGKADAHVLRPLRQYARWLEHMGRYSTARVLYARSLAIAEKVDRRSLLIVDPLYGIARTYRLEFMNGVEEDSVPASDPLEPDGNLLARVTNSQPERLDSRGELALQFALQVIENAQPVDHLHKGFALVELGDWYLCGERPAKGGLPEKSLRSYHNAWKELTLGGSTAALSAPRQLAYRSPSSSITQSHLTERDNIEKHSVELTFTVTKDGRTKDAVASATDATPSEQRQVLSAVKKARYAPRFENGEPADTPGVKLKERLVSRK